MEMINFGGFTQAGNPIFAEGVRKSAYCHRLFNNSGPDAWAQNISRVFVHVVVVRLF